MAASRPPPPQTIGAMAALRPPPPPSPAPEPEAEPVTDAWRNWVRKSAPITPPEGRRGPPPRPRRVVDGAGLTKRQRLGWLVPQDRPARAGSVRRRLATTPVKKPFGPCSTPVTRRATHDAALGLLLQIWRHQRTHGRT